jgi:hypothetical protein
MIALPRIATPIREVSPRIMELFTKQGPLTDEEWEELEDAERGEGE